MATSGTRRSRTHPLPLVSSLPSSHMDSACGKGSRQGSGVEALPNTPLLSKQRAGVLARVTVGFALQLLSIFGSISIFVDEGETCYLWTGTAVAIGLMLRTPTERHLERYSHVVSGVLAYFILDYHYERFPTALIMCTALSNALGQTVGEHAMRRVFPSTPLTNRDVQRLEFLSALMLFPVLLASVTASVPGSLGFHLFLGANLWDVFVNYTIGHISGTAVVLYPALVLPALWGRKQPFRASFVLPALLGLVGVGFLFAYADYGVFAFAAIIGTFGVIVSACSLLDQWSACLMEAIATALILGLTAGGRGPFHSINTDEAQRDVLLSTQLATTAGVVCGAFVCLSSTRFRLLQASEKVALDKAERMIETQTVQLCRVGHDMLNNTAIIWSMSESLAASLPAATGHASREELKTIQAAITMNGTLVKDMVDSFRPEGRSGAVCRTEVDLREMMDLHVHFANALARMGGKSIEATLDMDGTIKLLTDRDRLHQVLNNLVGNAVKYTVSGSITLRVARRRSDKGPTDTTTDSVILQVIDTGIGIDEEDISKIFGTLFRCPRGTKVASGTGLGLSSVLESCRLLGAEVTAESPGINQGSTFTLEFPSGAWVASIVNTTGKTDVDTATPFAVPAGGIRALVVDDSKVIRNMMRRYLIQLGCDVVALENVEEAKEHLLGVEAADAFDVVITDHHLGDGRCAGTDLISDIRSGRLRGLAVDMACILCSGMEVPMEEFGDNTFFIWKPFTQAEVSHALSAVATRRADADRDCSS